MIGYVTLGTSDLKRGAVFYDAIAHEMGVGRTMEGDTFTGWGEPGAGAGLGPTKAFDDHLACVSIGVMVALEAKDRALVDRLHAIALAHGGTDEGAPGERSPGFYAGYFGDPDGNKLNAFIMG